MSEILKSPLKKYDIFVIAFSILWIGVIMLDYINKHPIYLDSITEFSFYKLMLFFAVYGFLATFLYGKRVKLKRLKAHILSFILFVTVPISILAIAISFSKYHTPATESHQYFYLLANAMYVLFGGIVILWSSYCIGKQIVTRFLNKKVISQGHFTLHIVIGIIVTTYLLFILGAIGILNTWSTLMIIILPFILFYKTLWSSIKSVLSFDPDYTKLEFGLLMMLVFYFFINFLFILGPYPLGFDSRNLYINVPKLIAENNSLVQGFQPYNWELFSSLGLLLFKRVEVTMLMLQIGGVLSAMAAFHISQNTFKLNRTSSLLIAALLLVTPAISRQMYVELKVDLALMFFQLVTFQFYISHIVYKNRSKNAHIVFSIVLGVLFGFGLGIKLLHVFLMYGIIAAMGFKKENPFSTWAILIFGLGVILFLRLDEQTGLRYYHQYADMITYLLLGIGALFIAYSFIQDVQFGKKFAAQVVIICLCSILVFSPWIWNNYQPDQPNSMMSLIRGGGGGHDLDQQKLKQIYERISNQNQ